MLRTFKWPAGMLAGGVSVKSVNVHLPGRGEPEDISSLRNPAILRCPINISIRTRDQTDRFGAVRAVEDIHRGALTSRSDFEDRVRRTRARYPIKVAILALDDAPGVS